MSYVTCHISPVTIPQRKGQSGGDSRCRFCYQRGLPRLVLNDINNETSKKLEVYICKGARDMKFFENFHLPPMYCSHLSNTKKKKNILCEPCFDEHKLRLQQKR